MLTLPDEMKEVWGWFLDLNNTRPTGFGASPITFNEMLSYFDLYNIDVTTTEIDLIRMLDNIALEINRKQEEKKNNKIKK